MARTDTRLVVAIVSTAILSGTVAALVATKLAHPEAPPLPPRPAPVAEAPDCTVYKTALADCSQENTLLALKLRDATKPALPPAVCDEVSCVLNNYEGACCQPYKRPPSATTSLDRAQISAGVAAVRPQILACGDRIADRGTVRVHVKVAPDGHVTSVEPREDNALGRCVAAVMRIARFAKTDTGGSFGYPFVF